jgi:type I restriction enzyme R subunit
MDGQDRYPAKIQSDGQKALYDNLDNNVKLTVTIDETVKFTAKDGWRENNIKERQVANAIKKKLPDDVNLSLVMEVVKNQREY